MNKIRIIDLLNKIANGEEVPEKIKYRNTIFIYDKDNQCYVVKNDNYYDLHMSLSNHKGTDLNYEVEIIEEKEMCHKCHKYPAEYNQTYCEFCLGISKLEEKKIPEKLEEYIHTDSLNYNQCNYMFEILTNKYNEIIDYLKSKGE